MKKSWRNWFSGNSNKKSQNLESKSNLEPLELKPLSSPPRLSLDVNSIVHNVELKPLPLPSLHIAPLKLGPNPLLGLLSNIEIKPSRSTLPVSVIQEQKRSLDSASLFPHLLNSVQNFTNDVVYPSMYMICIKIMYEDLQYYIFQMQVQASLYSRSNSKHKDTEVKIKKSDALTDGITPVHQQCVREKQARNEFLLSFFDSTHVSKAVVQSIIIGYDSLDHESSSTIENSC